MQINNNVYFLGCAMTYFSQEILISNIVNIVAHSINKQSCFEAEAGLVVDCGNQKIHIPWSI